MISLISSAACIARLSRFHYKFPCDSVAGFRRTDYKLKTEQIDFIRNGSENHLPAHLSLSFKNADGEALLHRLDLMGICVSTGAACDSKSTQISHVLKAIDLDESYAKGTIRISFGRDNTKEDAVDIADALIRILKK